MYNVSLTAAVAFYFVGVLSAWFLQRQAWWELGSLLLVAGVVLLVVELRRTILLVVFLLAIAWTGFNLYTYTTSQYDLGERSVEVEVLIKSVASSNDWWTEYLCQLQSVDGKRQNQEILLRHAGERLTPGHRVQALVRTEEVTPAKNWTSYDQEKHLMIQGIHGIFRTNKVLASSEGQGRAAQWYTLIAKLREQLTDKLLVEPMGLAAALLLGNKQGLSSHAKYYLQGAGVSHIVALSGFHLVMLIALVEMLLVPLTRKRPRGRWFVGMAITLLVLFYLTLTGFQTSLLRAAIMLLFVRLLRWNGANALLVTAGTMVVLKPLLLLDAGFQLSVLAVAGLLIASEKAGASKWQQELRSYLGVQLLILPVLAWNFGFVSSWGLVGNILLTPLSVVIMVLGICYLLFASMGLGIIFVPALSVMAKIFLLVAKTLASLPLSYFHLGRGTFGFWLGYYLILVVLVWWRTNPALAWQVGWWELRYRLVSYKRTWFALCLAVLVFLFLSWPIPTLKVYFLDVGEGDGAVVRTPSGQVIVIDAGKGLELREFLRAHAINQVDVLLISHPHADHYKGLTYCLEEISVNTAVMWPKGEEEDYNKLFQELKDKGTKVTQPIPGQAVALGDGVKLKFYLPGRQQSGDDWNQKGIMLKLDYGYHSFLFTADGGSQVIEKLAQQIPQQVFTAVKVPHHGSRFSWNEEFWERLQTRWTVISVGKNYYGHPSDQVLEGLSQLGKNPLRTDMTRGLCFECSQTKVALKTAK